MQIGTIRIVQDFNCLCSLLNFLLNMRVILDTGTIDCRKNGKIKHKGSYNTDLTNSHSHFLFFRMDTFQRQEAAELKEKKDKQNIAGKKAAGTDRSDRNERHNHQKNTAKKKQNLMQLFILDCREYDK